VLIRDRARAIGFAAAALLLGVALIACGRHSAPSPSPTFEPSATSSQASPGASSGELDTTSPDSSASDFASASDLAGSTPPPTPDAVASELDQINQLINDINDSISDSSQQGGE
jgi:hypothetical protein